MIEGFFNSFVILSILHFSQSAFLTINARVKNSANAEERRYLNNQWGALSPRSSQSLG